MRKEEDTPFCVINGGRVDVVGVRVVVANRAESKLWQPHVGGLFGNQHFTDFGYRNI